MIYLDHAGTTLYAKSLIDEFAKQMLSNVYGNPHSASTTSQLSTRRMEDARVRALRFFNADPEHFDLIFVSNATAGIKIVMEAFREQAGGFWFGYHKDAHTSLVGVREAAVDGHRCFMSDGEVETWLGESAANTEVDDSNQLVKLFAYPAQSNMSGRRLPLHWAHQIRTSTSTPNSYSLLDAAALVSTAPLDLSDPLQAPDFTVVSFYKIFGFPDLGALIVRRDAGSILRSRRYFGGGTVEMVTCGKENWHIPKSGSLHEQLEDGTLPIHSVLALDVAISVHDKIFGSMRRISRHTGYLARLLHGLLTDLRHYNDTRVCELYSESPTSLNGIETQGPIIALNIRNSTGHFINNSEVEKLANVRNIQLRSGGLCNPGGIASSLELAPWEMKRNFAAGQRCGNENNMMDGKPTGMLRTSLGAMSNKRDVETFVAFVKDFFTEQSRPAVLSPKELTNQSEFHIESLSIYPIKSCGAWSIPSNVAWHLRSQGLAWDREWCLVHQGTRQALSQKKYPRMALIKPSIDLEKGSLRVRYSGHLAAPIPSEICVPLSEDPTVFHHSRDESPSVVCGDAVSMQTYSSPMISDFFTKVLDTPCTLARFPSSSSIPSGESSQVQYTGRHSKTTRPSPLFLSNESPLLVISRSSVNRLNENIKRLNPNGKAAHASVFRANIVLAESTSTSGYERPYAEDRWGGLRILPRSNESLRETKTEGPTREAVDLDVWGPCRRCQMVCVDQMTAVKDEEPFVTLAKTRRLRVRGLEPGKPSAGGGGGVFFGVHAALTPPLTSPAVARSDGGFVLRVGDRVEPIVYSVNGENDEKDV